MIRLGIATSLLLLAPPAFAHGTGLPIGPAELWHHWTFDPLVCVFLLVGHWLYGRGVARAWRRAGFARVVPVWRVVSFVAGELILVLALISPLDPLGETLLSAHMAQHLMLTVVAPPLLVLGLPGIAWLWAVPADWRRARATRPVRMLVVALDRLSRPLVATLVAIGVMWAWHIPAFFQAALEDESMHTLEHITFFLAALLSWRAALSPHASPLVAAGVTFGVFMAGGMLGGLLTLAPAVLYDWYGNSPLLWSLSPLEDQQLAGLLMWVVAGGVYLAVFAACVFRVATVAGPPRSRPSHGIIRASTSSPLKK